MHSDYIGRDTVANAIQQAEQEISKEAGFNLMPEWTMEERLPYPRPALPEVYGSGLNPRWQMKSVEAERGHLLYGGIRAKSLISANAIIVRTDTDGDGYAETCTVTAPVTITDTNEIHIYYPNQGGVDEWEVRPIKVSISGGFATITFKAWQVVSQSDLEALDPQPIDADLVASYVTLVDVYRVYNDPSKQVEFLWEGDPICDCSCTACQLGTQDGCFILRDTRLGFVVPSPATWDAATSAFVSTEWSACREPDQIRLYYKSGFKDTSLPRPYSEISNYWKFAIAVFAVSKFERAVCGGSNVTQFVEKWRRDAAFSSQQEGGFTVTAEQASNRLGTSLGALYAWRRVQQSRINK